MRRLKEESGFSLIGVMLVLTILSVLGLSMATLSYGSVKVSSGERDDQSAYYIAEAGLTYEMGILENKIEEIYDATESGEEFFALIADELITTTPQPTDVEFAESFGEEPSAEINITDITEEESHLSRTYNVESTGKIGSKERTLSQILTVTWTPKYTESPSFELPPLAVYTRENITLTNGPVIGSIGTQSTEQHAITAGEGVYKVQEGNVYVPVIDHSNDNRTCSTTPKEDYKAYSVTRPTWEDNMPCPTEVEDMWEFPSLPAFPDNEFEEYIIPSDVTVGSHKVIDRGDLLITNYQANHYVLNMEDYLLQGKNLKFNRIAFNSKRNLTIHVGDGDKGIVVDHLDLTNGHIKVTGEGKLTFYVKDKITFGSGSTLNSEGNINNVNIFYKGSEKLQLAGNQKLYGSIYAETANLDLTGSGGIYGNIFTGGNEVTISGGADIITQLIFAPEATVKISGGGHIYGVIMSKKFNHNSGATVEYGEPFVLEGPISPKALGLSHGETLAETEARPDFSRGAIQEQSE